MQYARSLVVLAARDCPAPERPGRAVAGGQRAGMRKHLLAGVLVLCGHAAFGRSPPLATPLATESCLPAIASAERQSPMPAKLLDAIALVESGRPDPVTGRTAPWPWTIDAEGIDHFYTSKAEAIAAVQALQRLGVRSIDVGCMQINLLHHPTAFASLDEAFDPVANAAYGARFLGLLYRQTGSWPRAAAAYHSQTPAIGQDYESRVMAVWPLASRFADADFGRPAAARVDYRRYTPAFAASLRRLAEDRARLDARFGGILRVSAGIAARRVTPARGPRAGPRPLSAWKG